MKKTAKKVPAKKSVKAYSARPSRVTLNSQPVPSKAGKSFKKKVAAVKRADAAKKMSKKDKC